MASDGPQESRLRALLEENRRLKRAIEELTVLNDLAREIGASTSSQDVISTIIRRSLRSAHAEQGVITLVDEEGHDPMKTLVRTMVTSREQHPFHFSQSLLGWMYLNKKPLVVNRPETDERFSGVKWDESIRTLLAVPLLVKSKLVGVLTVYNKKGDGEFSEEDQRLLAIIAGQSAQVVENARLYEEEQALLRMREEIRVASEIQSELLPVAPPRVVGYDIAGSSIPAQVVGGDYFDFIAMDEHRIAVCLGDVSGKGLPAALLMANLQATIRGQTLSAVSPRECLERSNSLLHRSTTPEKFATLFYGVLDVRKNELCYSSAGHEKPFLFSAGRDLMRLDVGGMILSFLDNATYEIGTVPIDPGDVLVFFSDGVTDAVNDRDEAFGEEKLASVISDHAAESASDLLNTIVGDVQAHAGDRPQLDDITLVVIRREE